MSLDKHPHYMSQYICCQMTSIGGSSAAKGHLMNTSSPDPGDIARRLTTIGHALHHRLHEQSRDGALHPKAVRLLGAIDGRVDAHGLADRLTRGGKRLDALATLGLIVRDGDGWRLTDAGRAMLDRVNTERAGLLDGIPTADLESLARTLDLLAEKLDVDDRRGPRGRGSARGPRGFGPRGPFDPRVGFGSRGGFGPRGEHAPGSGPNLHHGFRVGERPGPGGCGHPAAHPGTGSDSPSGDPTSPASS